MHTKKIVVERIQATIKNNPAIYWNFIGYGVTAVAGPLAALVIAKYFSPSEQGYYYTFNSLLGLQIFLELGFGVCLVHIVSHEFASLELDKTDVLTGPEKSLHRLASLSQLAHKWFSIASLIFALGVGIAGEFFFTRFGDGVAWRLPWWMLCIGASSGLYQLAPMSVLQGCNFMAWTARARAIQNAVRSLLVLALILCGGGLFSASIAACVSSLILFLLLNRKWNRFFKAIHVLKCKFAVSWKKEIWPFQSRIAMSWASGYFIFSTFNPIIFAKVSPAAAGRFGITWTMISALSNVSQIFVTTRQAELGIKMVKEEWVELRRLWFKILKQSIGVCILLGFVFLFFLELVRHYTKFGDRFLGFPQVFPLLLAAIVNQYIFTVATLTRAEKKEPFLWPSVAGAAFIFGGNLFFVTRFGVSGLAWNYCAITCLSVFWASFIYKTTAMVRHFSV